MIAVSIELEKGGLRNMIHGFGGFREFSSEWPQNFKVGRVFLPQKVRSCADGR